MLPSASVAVALVAALVSPVSACTNLLVSAGASGRSMSPGSALCADGGKYMVLQHDRMYLR